MVKNSEIKATLERRINARKAANREKWLRAKRDFDAIIAMIETDYNPQRIYCWGSLLDEAKFNAMSDIDIGVEGITDPEKYFELLGKAANLTNIPVDIVQMEKIQPAFSSIIKRKGVVVYERKD